jgi:hypothetical protein
MTKVLVINTEGFIGCSLVEVVNLGGHFEMSIGDTARLIAEAVLTKMEVGWYLITYECRD